MILEGVEIEDTFAEAFGMRATRLLVTADTARWARIAGETATVLSNCHSGACSGISVTAMNRRNASRAGGTGAFR